MMFLMRLYFWKQPNKNRERPQLVRCHVHSRFFYFVKLLNLPALVNNVSVYLLNLEIMHLLKNMFI